MYAQQGSRPVGYGQSRQSLTTHTVNLEAVRYTGCVRVVAAHGGRGPVVGAAALRQTGNGDAVRAVIGTGRSAVAGWAAFLQTSRAAALRSIRSQTAGGVIQTDIGGVACARTSAGLGRLRRIVTAGRQRNAEEVHTASEGRSKRLLPHGPMLTEGARCCCFRGRPQRIRARQRGCRCASEWMRARCRYFARA